MKDIHVRALILEAIKLGKKKSEIYQHVVDNIEVPRPMVRRVGRDMKLASIDVIAALCNIDREILLLHVNAQPEIEASKDE